MIWIILFTLEIVISIILLSFSLSVFFGAPYFPSSRKRITEMIDMAKLKAGDRILELGSGDGRILFEIAKRGYDVVGVEINLVMVIISNIRIFFSPYRNKIKVYWGNFWSFDASGFNTVFCYLFPITMDKIYEKLNKEMKAGSKIISNTFKSNNAKEVDKKGRVFVYFVE